MKLLPLNKLGAHVNNSTKIVNFGLFLPWVSAAQGNQLKVKIIHEKDQFLKEIPTKNFNLTHSVDPTYGDYWSGQADLNSQSPHPNSAWGTPGRYIYRFELYSQHLNKQIDWIIDPFSREFGIGKHSAFTLGYQPYDWGGDVKEMGWKTPVVRDLIMYELMINEFAENIEGMINRLDYLADLGVNCIEIMPVSNVISTIDWGYMPVGYFGVDERFGKRYDFQRLVHEAHNRKIAVVIDAVYGHTSSIFPYSHIYRELQYEKNPFLGGFAKNMFGGEEASTDYHKEFTQDFFFTVNHFWLDCFHIDGFRYDCVPNFFEGPMDTGYANLVYSTYQKIKNTGPTGHWQRFFDGNTINIIQCAEQLEGPRDIVYSTYSNCTWQNETLASARAIAKGGDGSDMYKLGMHLGLDNYCELRDANNDVIEKTALQYISNHDWSRFICNFGVKSFDNNLLKEGDRSKWFKVQPYLIALFTAKGIPMLWQGDEFGENYFVPQEGWGRVMLFRPVKWEEFYSSEGKNLLQLVRKLISIRKSGDQFRRGGHYFYNDYQNYQSKKVMLYHMMTPNRYSLIALNFGDNNETVPFSFPYSGNYIEELNGIDNQTVTAGVSVNLDIPSNYGKIWTHA